MTIQKTIDEAKALSLDLAMRRKALAVNCGIIASRHGGEIAEVVAAAFDRNAVHAAARAIAALSGAGGGDWSDEVRRDLRLVVRALDRVARRHGDRPEHAVWLADRLRELAAQDERVRVVAELLGRVRRRRTLWALGAPVAPRRARRAR